MATGFMQFRLKLEQVGDLQRKIQERYAAYNASITNPEREIITEGSAMCEYTGFVSVFCPMSEIQSLARFVLNTHQRIYGRDSLSNRSSITRS